MDAHSLPQNLFQIHPTPASEPLPQSFFMALLDLISTKDKSTHAHSFRVSEITREWMEYLQLADVQKIALAALVHDIGKVGILDDILQKPSALTSSEREQMEQHSEIGYQMVRDYPGVDETIVAGIRHHHERWDGRGYPLGLKEAQIPFSARVIAIVDAYDAMTSERPYKKGRPSHEALAEITREAGRQFCPELASKFIQFMHARNN